MAALHGKVAIVAGGSRGAGGASLLKRSAAAWLAQLIAAAAPPLPLPRATAISSHPSHPLLPPQEPVWRELSVAREPPCM